MAFESIIGLGLTALAMVLAIQTFVLYLIVKHNDRIRGWAYSVVGTGAIGKPLGWLFLLIAHLILNFIAFYLFGSVFGATLLGG